MDQFLSRAIYFALVATVFLQRVSGQCDNILPGIVKLTKGVDVTFLDVTPLDNSEDDGYRRAVIDLTCKENKKWTSPYNANVVYNLPDQVDTTNSIPGGVLDATFEMYTNYEDLKRSLAIKLGLGASYQEGMFSASGTYKWAQSLTTNSSKKMAQVMAYFSGTQMDLIPYWQAKLSSSAKLFIENLLPQNFSENPAKFQEFFERFGTHYFSSGKFGGLFQVALEIESSLIQTMSAHEIGAQAKGAFYNTVKAMGGISGAINAVSAKFSSKIVQATRYYGGSANLFDAEGWKGWWPTVAENPWLFGGKLESVLTLLPDGPKLKALKTAYNIYLDHAYLEELRRTLYSFIGKRYAGENVAQAYLKRLNALYDAGATDHNAIAALGFEITNYIITPDWFLKETNLCFNWFPDGMAGQCGGNASSRNLCAKPNAMTEYYRDDSDWRGGGCQMSWGIMSPVSVSWFRKVQICFRYHPDGDPGQCGNHKPEEFCAPVGTYTPNYRDDTDWRAGGCKMSWKLSVPKDAPGWMLNTRLCFFWFPDGMAGQCGGGADQNLCARANHWTPYYKDDTDWRTGGCQMSWGLKTSA